MLLQVEKGKLGGIATAVHKYAKANNKYIKNYDSAKQRTYLMYNDANNLYGYPMSKKLPVDNFKWETNLSIFTDDFIKNYDEASDTGYLLFVDVIYTKNLREKHKHLPFLPEKVKRNKVTKLTCEITDKNNFCFYFLIKTRTKATNEFKKDFYKLCNSSVYGKAMENFRKHRDIRLVKIHKKRNILTSEPNYHSTKYISEDLLIMEMKKREIYMNKPIYFGQAILYISKMLIYEFWYDYVLPMYGENIK